MKNYSFCTYCDINYLPRALTLYDSLAEHCEIPFNLYILCLDEESYSNLSNRNENNIIPISLNVLEKEYPELLIAKSNRSLIEYYFTLSPIFPLFIIEKYNPNIITCLDADLMFFSSPSTIYEELGGKSIYIIEHRFRDKFKGHEISGIFNVQCQLFRNDKAGLDCLHRWKAQTLDWCYDRHEEGKFADQKYLDEWPHLYGSDLVISKNIGVGVAPWNIDQEEVRESEGNFYINNIPIVFYHFHGLKVFNKFLAKTGLSGYHTDQYKEIETLYRCYLIKLFQNGVLNSKKKKNLRPGNYGNFFGTLRLALSGVKYKDNIYRPFK